MEMWLPGWEKQGEVGKRVQTFSNNMNKVQGSNAKHGNNS